MTWTLNAVIALPAAAELDVAALLRHAPRAFCNYEGFSSKDGIANPMITGRAVSRTLLTLGSVVLLVAAAMHCIAYAKFAAPALHGSNLPAAMQSVFEIGFLSMAWSWFVLALIVLIVTYGEARLGKSIALVCGFAVLIQALWTVSLVGFFIGNEMIGAASLLIIIGGFLFHGSRAES